MKSILVDALRQSQGKDSDSDADSALSDSGSFDTTQTEIGPTGNDENVIRSDDSAKDLELLKTGVFEKTDMLEQTGTFVSEELEPGGLDGLPMPMAANAATMGPATAQTAAVQTSEVHLTAPAIVRFTPLLCIALAISSATAWTAYRYVAAIDTGNNVGASPRISGVSGNSGEVENTVHISGAGRFPFIDSGLKAAVGDSSE